MRPLFSLLLIAVFTFTACNDKKDNGVTPDGEAAVPLVSAAGTPSGQLVEVEAGIGGAHVTSADGLLTIFVPPHVFTTPVTFSIQPVTNTVRKHAPVYRLRPEGKLNTPVTLTFRYSDADLEGTAENLLLAAYQQADGTWKAAPATLNKMNKTLTVTTDHLSGDWTVTGGLYVQADETILREAQQTELTGMAYNGGDDGSLLAPLAPGRGLTGLSAIGNWRIAVGTGSLSSTAQPGRPSFHYKAVYKAPDHAEQPSVVINTEVDGFNRVKDPGAPDGIRRTGKLVLTTNLTVAGSDYIVGNLGPARIAYTSVAVSQADYMAIEAHDAHNPDAPAIYLAVRGAGRVGEFPCGDFDEQGNALLQVGSGAAAYISKWLECGSPYSYVRYSSGKVVITKWGNPGELVEGHFSGPVYIQNGICDYSQQTLNLTFSAIRD